MSVLIIIILLLYAFLSWRKTAWGIYLLILFLPSYLIRFNIGFPLTLLETMIWLLFFIWLIKLYKTGGRVNFNIFKPSTTNLIPKSFRLPIILFILSATLAVFISDNQLAALGIWKAYFIEPLIFLIILVYTIKNKQQIKNIIYCLGILTIVIGIFALIQKFTGVLITNPFWQDEATRRITTFFNYPNANSLLIAPIIILTIGNLLTDKKISCQILNVLILLLGILTLFWVKSAGAIIATLAGLIFLLIYFKKTRVITSLVVGIFIILTLSLSSSPYNFQNIQKQLTPHKLGLDATSLEIRINQWQETGQMLRDNPIIGAGLANYQNKVKIYHQFNFIEIYLYPHNFFLNFWVEIGLLGLITIVWILIVFFKLWVKGLKVLKEKKDSLLTLTIGTAMITLLVHGLVDVPYFKNDLSILFWLIVGLLIILTNITKRKDAGVV